MAIIVQQTITSGVVTDTPYQVYSSGFNTFDVFINPPSLPALLGSGIPSIYWAVSGNYTNYDVYQLTEAQYVAQLEAVMLQATNTMGITVQNYIQSRYPSRVQSSLGFLWSSALTMNQPSVVAQCKAAWDWTVTVIQGYLYYATQVEACTTIGQINALTLDLSVYDATDPMVNMNEILGLQGLAIPIYPPSGSVPVSGSPI